MDYEMPRMNGPTATSVLRDMGCKVPVIGITGNVLAEDKEYFKSHGAIEVLAKPVSLSQLDGIVATLNASKLQAIYDPKKPSPRGAIESLKNTLDKSFKIFPIKSNIDEDTVNAIENSLTDLKKPPSQAAVEENPENKSELSFKVTKGNSNINQKSSAFAYKANDIAISDV
jgi:CheY-like chemotaxis protein